MNNKQRQEIYDYVCELNEITSGNTYSHVEKLNSWVVLQLLYKSNCGNEMATLLLAEFLYYIKKNNLKEKSEYENLELFFS